MKIKLNSNNVSQYLFDVGICQKQDIELTKITPKCNQAGRDSLIFLCIDLPNVGQIFIKQAHHNTKSSNIINNEFLFHKFLHSCLDLSYAYSLNLEIIHFDASNSILIYKCPKNYTNLERYYRNKKLFLPRIGELVGTTLASLHLETWTAPNCYDLMNKYVEGKSYYKFPHPSYLLDKLEPESLLKELHLGGNSFIHFYQRSKSLRAAVTELVVNHHHFCLTHNNLQLDNILIPNQWENLLDQKKVDDEPIIKLNNWERCSWSEPAFDLGTIIAGYLSLWLESLILHPDIKLEKSLQLAIRPLETIQPSLVALTKAYISNFPQVLKEFPDFLCRVIQFTGLALIYKILANIQCFQDFSLKNVYILQVATKLLCNPEKSFESVFGMTKLALIELINFSQLK